MKTRFDELKGMASQVALAGILCGGLMACTKSDGATQADVPVSTTAIPIIVTIPKVPPRFNITDMTRFCAKGRMSSDLAAALYPERADASSVYVYGGVVADVLKAAWLKAGRTPIDPQDRWSAGRFLLSYDSPACADNGINILVSQTAEMNSLGKPYKIVVRVSQKGLKWQMIVVRPNGESIPVAGTGISQEEANTIYWDIRSDVYRMAETLTEIIHGNSK
jgi:hypothetical protein